MREEGVGGAEGAAAAAALFGFIKMRSTQYTVLLTV